MNNQRKLDEHSDEWLDSVYKEILDKNGDVSFSFLISFIMNQDRRDLEKLIQLYTEIESQNVKNEIVGWIGARYKEKGLILLLDNLYAQQLIGNGSIRAVLKKRPLFAGADLDSSECDAIVSALLGFLDTPCPEVDSFDDEREFIVDLKNRASAARILAVLYKYPHTSNKSIEAIHLKSYLTATYILVDAGTANGIYYPETLSDYLSGRRR